MSVPSRPLSKCAGAAFAVFTLLAGVRTGRAQDAAVLQRVTDLNKKAVEAYENLDMDEASKYLRQALELCAAEGLNNHKAKARTHIHLGIVMVGGLKQRDRGIQQFKRALEIDPKIQLTRSLVNPEIQAAFEDAQRDMGITPGAPKEPTSPKVAQEPSAPPSTPPSAPPSPEPAPAAPAKEPEPAHPAAEEPAPEAPRRVRGIVHTPVTEGRTNSPIVVKAALEASLGHDKVILAYRPEGATDFLARDMEKDEQGWYVARIPEAATRGAAVSYYIEARNRTGLAVAASGSPAEPYVVTLGSGGGAVSSREEAPPTVVERRRPEATETEAGAFGHKYWASLGIGSGFGWARGTPEVNPTDDRGVKIEFPGGFAPARLMHFAPEVGLQVAPNLLLSIQGRIQVVTSATEVRDTSCPDDRDPITMVGTCPPAKWALAFLGKATWLLGDPKPLRFFASMSAGGGEIRHLVTINNLTDCGADGRTQCQDTLLGGVILLGPGAGVSYDFGRALSGVVSLNSLVGLPNATVNFDLNIAVAMGL